ncbi:BCCT family transporter, partial [Pseudoalteromonas citrea]|uniref:BCCT family transporter n=1 Tax=Pseudoalteromonas citrea TaxID=43655 RepID=UPI0020162703
NRELAMCVLFIRTGFTLMWMTFFRNSAIYLIMNQGIASLGEAVAKDVAVSILVFLEQFPLSGVLSFVATLMGIIFFVN